MHLDSEKRMKCFVIIILKRIHIDEIGLQLIRLYAIFDAMNRQHN